MSGISNAALLFKEGRMKRLHPVSKSAGETKHRIKYGRRCTLAVFVMAVFLSAMQEAVYASNPAFTQAMLFFSDARSFIFGITTAGAIVGLGVGAFFKFFSMGDHQRIQTGNKVMLGSLVGWGVVNGAFLLFSTIQQYTPQGQVVV